MLFRPRCFLYPVPIQFDFVDWCLNYVILGSKFDFVDCNLLSSPYSDKTLKFLSSLCIWGFIVDKISTIQQQHSL